MSVSSAQAWMPAAPTTSAPETTRTRIEVVPGRKVAVRPSAWPFVLLAVVLVVFTLILPLIANTQMAQRAYEIRDYQVTLAELNAQIETLEADVLEASSSQRLEAKAREIGLVRAGDTGTIALSGGTVEGGVPAE